MSWRQAAPLHPTWFRSLAEARTTLAAWREDYNNHRPHSALRDLTPVQFRTGGAFTPGPTPAAKLPRLAALSWGSDHPEAQHEALRARRAREQRADFAAEYARHAGAEGTIAQGVRSCALRRTRYLGHAKTHFGHLMTAAAMNVVRLLRWMTDEPKAATRVSAFA